MDPIAKTVGQVFLGALGGIGIGVVVAMGSIGYSLRKQLREAIDREERIAVTKSALVNVLAIFAYLGVLLFIAAGTRDWILPTLATVGFMAIVFWQSAVVVPRAMARRHALEAARDPVAAAARRRRERLQCRVGMAIGALGGFGGLIGGLLVSGRIAF